MAACRSRYIFGDKTRLAFNIVVTSTNGEELIIGCATINLFETDGRLITGYQEIAVWPFCSIDSQLTGMDPFLGSLRTLPSDKICKVLLQFDTYAKDVYYTVSDRDIMTLLQFPMHEDKKDKERDKPLTTEELVIVNSVLARDPIDPSMTDEEKQLMVKSRDYLREVPNTLTYYLMSIKWYPDMTQDKP